jgi:YHS domain-containing protein
MNTSLNRRNAVRLVAWIAAASFASSLPSLAAEKMPLAMKGYDPVAYFTVGKPTQGLPQFEYEWDERRYRFSSAGHRDLFKADPARYAPQFGNLCAMALADARIVVADPENWLVSEGKLYIFGKPAPMGPALFQKDLAGNVTKANQNWSIIRER